MVILAMFKVFVSGTGTTEDAVLVEFCFCFLFEGLLLILPTEKPAATAVEKAKKDLLEQWGLGFCSVFIKSTNSNYWQILGDCQGFMNKRSGWNWVRGRLGSYCWGAACTVPEICVLKK